MKHIMAFDGGGSKTHVAVFDLAGHCLYETIGPGSNYYSGGGTYFVKTISTLYRQALKGSGLIQSAMAHIYLGLSGADLPSDFAQLNTYCTSIFAPLPFTIVNDAWIVMRSGLQTPFGAVAIAGTGTNAAAINHAGKRAILRSLGYTLGIYGGGLDIAREALHYAFRADELTYTDTLLKARILNYFACDTMDALVDFFYPSARVDRHKLGGITPLVFACAAEQDRVALEILHRAGTCIGQQTAGVIKQVAIEHDTVPVVIGGKVFSGMNNQLIESMMQAIQIVCKNAYLVRPVYPPVVGAYLAALDALGIHQDAHIDRALQKRGSEHV